MAGSGWKITAQLTDQVENTTAGQTVIGVRIYFITGSGNEGSVFIPNQQYTAKNVHSRVKVQAELIDEIGELSDNFPQPF
jgi:hypothetical protein